MIKLVLKTRPRGAMLSAALLTFLSAQSAAQDNQAQATPATGGLEEVIVTATKRETDLMETPLAISVFSQEALTRQNIKAVRDLKGAIPNLQMGTGEDSGTAVSIRGVSSNDFTEVAEAAVSIHVDGAYSPRPQGALALMHDLERVEVLRGPQGTLFGMNSAAGTLNLIPAKPDLSDTYGSIDVDFGLDEYNRRELRGMVNLPISDTFGLRGTFITHQHDGFMDQVSDETDIDAPLYGLPADGIPDVDQRRNRPVGKADYYNNADEWAVRLMALWEATDNLSFLLSLDRFSDQGAGDMEFVDCKQAAGTPFACTHDLRWAQINVPGRKDLTIDDTRLKVAYDVTDSMALEYRYSSQEQERSEITDIDGGNHYGPVWGSYGQPLTDESSITYAYPIADSANETVHSNYETTTHEIQWKSTGDSALQYVVGFFSLEEVKSIRYDVEELAYKTWYGPGDIDGLPDTQVYDQARRTTESNAIFGQLDIELSERWSATLGYRRSDDKKTDSNSNTYARWWGDVAWYNGEHTPAPGSIKAHQSDDLTFNMGGGVSPLGTGATAAVSHIPYNEYSWEEDTYRIGLQHYIDDDQMLFISYATGYKMGGFYEDFDVCNNGCVQLLTFEPEYVDTYELGYKGTLLDQSLRLSATYFLSEYTDMQDTGMKVVGTDTRPGPTFGNPVEAWTTDNVGESEIQGLELEFEYLPWENGHFSGYFTWLETEIKKASFVDGYMCAERQIFGQPLCGSPGYDTIVGNELKYAPEFSLSLNYEHNVLLDSGFTLTPFVSVHWQDDMWLNNQNYDGAHLSQKQEAYYKIDASLRLSSPDDTYYFELAGMNLTDEETRNFHGNAAGVVTGSYDDPRLYSLRFGYKFQ